MDLPTNEIALTPGGSEICVNVQEFAYAMGSAQGQIIGAAGQAMIYFFLIGVVVGAAGMYLWLYAKNRIDEYQEPD